MCLTVKTWVEVVGGLSDAAVKNINIKSLYQTIINNTRLWTTALPPIIL